MTPITHENLIAAGWVEDPNYPKVFYTLGTWDGRDKRLILDFSDGQVAEAGHLFDYTRPLSYVKTMESLATMVKVIRSPETNSATSTSSSVPE